MSTDNPNNPVRMPSAQESLDKIGDILGARENNYNNPKDNFDDIAVVWTQLLVTEGIIPRGGKVLSALSVARLMVGMKLVRDAFKVKLDNWVDTAGYGVCGLRIAEFMELVEAAEKRLNDAGDTIQEFVDNLIVYTPTYNKPASYEAAVSEFYKIYNVDISRPMSHREKILLHNYLAERGFLNDGE